ncbi:MAG: NUDIX domain-containing protein [Candidatus Nealsonbacteria bacterium]|nr:NUDIX domain-containing protein [Candidatus Nealsonbacteria bacterium]
MSEGKVEKEPKQKEVTANPTMGLFAIIFDVRGRLLVKRRQKWETLPGDWDLPGGAADAKKFAEAENELVIGRELQREVLEETGIAIASWDIDNMPAMYPAVLKAGKDVAFIIIIGRCAYPTVGEWRYVDTVELLAMCDQPKGNQLVSGFGKRMCRLCLKGLTFSKDVESARLARIKLAKCY